MSKVSILYTGSFLILDTGKGHHSFRAYSGQPDRTREKDIYFFDNTESRQKLEKVGPIPQGAYFCIPDEIVALPTWKMKLIWALPESVTGVTEEGKKQYLDAWGACRLSIHPEAGNNQGGRPGGFFIHGGTQPGSAGCIDLHEAATKFFEILIASTRGSRLDKVPVDVNYRVHTKDISNIA